MQANRTRGVIAIDFGTTNTSVAWMRCGGSRPGVVKLPASHNVSKCTASSIETAFRCDDDGSIVEFGESAYLWRGKFHDRTCYNFKPELTDSENTAAYELAKKWLKLVYQLIKKALNGEDIDDYQFVIGHPVKWTYESQKKLLQIAKEAGFQKVKSLREPIGAALYLQSEEIEKIPKGKSLIIDFGGGTIDFVLLDIDGKNIRINRAGGNDRLGGRDVDELICDHLKTKCNLQDVDQDAKIVYLIKASRYLKKQLSDKPHESDFSTNVMSSRVELGNVELHSLCKPVFENIKTEIQDFLNATDQTIESNNITSVILCGGSAKLLGFRDLIEDLFPERIYEYSQDSGEIIVKGLTLIETVLDNYLNDQAKKTFQESIEKLIKQFDQELIGLYSEGKVLAEYHYVIKELMPGYEQKTWDKETSKRFVNDVVQKMSSRFICSITEYLRKYRLKIKGALEEPHQIIKDYFGKDMFLPDLITPIHIQSSIDEEEFYKYVDMPLSSDVFWIFFNPLCAIEYIFLESKKDKLLRKLSQSVLQYFQYKTPSSGDKLFNKGSYVYQVIEEVKKNNPELVLIHNNGADASSLSEKKKRYKSALDELWNTYCKNFMIGE